MTATRASGSLDDSRRITGGFDRVAFMTGAVGALGVVMAVRTSIAAVLPPCPLHAATGLDCPGCGMTRAVHALAEGDVPTAIGHNALAMLVLVPLLGAVWWAWLRRRPMPRILAARRFAPVFVTAVAAFSVLRNVPVAPFDALAAN